MIALTVVGTKTVTAGSATFTNATNNTYLFSVDTSAETVAGTLPLNTTISLPYTAGAGTYTAYTTPVADEQGIPFAFCNDTAYDWTFGYSYPAGTFSTSGSITATLITKKNGVITPWPAFQVTNIATVNLNIVAAPLVVNGVTLSNTIGLSEGGDAIRAKLTTSAAAYDAAAVNEWIAVTNTEYNLLQNNSNIPGAGTYLTNNIAMSTNADANFAIGTCATTASTGYFTTVAANNYIYAFRFKTPNTAAAGNGIVRFNSQYSNLTYTALGTSGGVAGRLPNQYGTVTGNTNYSFVLKRPTAITQNTTTFVSIYMPVAGYIGNNTTISAAASFEVDINHSSMTFGTGFNVLPLYQVLATAAKSW